MTTEDHLGEVLASRYRLHQLLAEGGMGAIYLGEHVLIGSHVAVKILRGEFASNERMVTRFYREAQAAAAIKHRNVVDVFDVGVAPWGEPYIVMEYLEGESLYDLLWRSGPLPLPAALGLMEQILPALAAAHEQGIIHRDLKPENIFVVQQRGDDPTVKLIDFGISKFLTGDDEVKLTRTGSVLGTLEYMSPEQAAGQPIDHLSDIYAAGVIFYQMLSGTVPYVGDNYNEIMAKILTEAPIPPSEAYADFPANAEPLVMRALSREPEKRYQSSLQMLAAMRQLEGFDTAKTQLRQVAAGLAEPTIAAGDLGDLPEGRPSGVARAVLEQVAHDATPGEWARSERPAPPRRSLRGPIIAVSAGFLVILIALVLVFRPDAHSPEETPADQPPPVPAESPAREPPAEPPEAEEPPPAEEEGVEITVTGQPEGAQIFFDGLLVPMNPFRVEKRGTIAALEVRAEGFQKFGVAVVPTENRIVEVVLKPTKGRSAGGTKGGSSTETKKAAAAASASELIIRNRQNLAITKRRHELRRCYNQALWSGDAPKDKELLIRFRVDVSEKGTVLGTKLGGSGATVTSLNECFKRSINDWSFPPGDGEPVEFSFAFAPPEPRPEAEATP